MVVDGRNGEVLGGKNDYAPLDFASTTKIRSAMVVLRLAGKEPGVLDEVVTFSSRADQTVGSTSDVHSGERVAVRELLYGLLLPSGNDASVALAEHFGHRLNPSDAPQLDPLAAFVAAMNRTAKELGLKDTHFENPHGLTARTHKSTARDLAALARIALATPGLPDYVGTRRHGSRLVDSSGVARDVVWANTNQLLGVDGYDGIKNRHDDRRRSLPGRQRPSGRRPTDRRDPGQRLLRGAVYRRPEPLPLGLAPARTRGARIEVMSQTQTITQVDAFADRPFAGNPAAVCILDRPASESWMRAVANEMNLSETAFLHPEGSDYRLRWFTPAVEVDLCGHATLASAHVLWEEGRLSSDQPARFQTRSGLLTAWRRGGLIEMDFPAKPVESRRDASSQGLLDGLSQALGCSVVFAAFNAFDCLVEVASEPVLRSIRPDFGRWSSYRSGA